MTGNFLYFGFGSNLLKQRIRILNASAVFKCIAKLEDYKLTFGWVDDSNVDFRWKGRPATIEYCPGEHVWGCVWTMSNSDLPNIDKQEGVSSKIYKPMEIDVQTSDGETLRCRSYQLSKNLASDKRPSPQYLDVLVRGAKQNSIPDYYIKKLQGIETNGYDGPLPLYDEIVQSLDAQY